jgi:RNA polymerase sigma factor (sigma-70 family)
MEDEVIRLTRGLVRCEDAAWRDFHARFYSRLKAQVQARGVPECEAPEVVQRVYLRVLRHAKMFRSHDDFDAWLSCLTRCEVIDSSRRERRRSWLGERYQQWHKLRRVAITREAVDLEGALRQLQEDERSMLVRHYVEGWTQEDLAREQATTVKAVKSKLARLRKRLRGMLENPDVC